MKKSKTEEIEQAVAKAEENRRHEAQVNRLKSQLKIEKDKLKIADQELEAAQARYELYTALGDVEGRGFNFERRRQTGRATAIVVLTDWHVEETINPETISGKNEYSLKIASKRIKRCCEKIPELLAASRTMSDIREMVVALLGDFMTGYIHEELLEQNSLSPVETLLFLRDHITEAIQFLLRECDVKQIVIPTAFGNHGRTTVKRRISTGYANSYEWLLYNFLAKDFADEKRVVWKIGKGAHNLLDVQGKIIRFSHGDDFKFYGGVGGLNIPVNKAISQWDKTEPASLDIFGHWHQHQVSRKFICSNCLIGYSPYARAIKAEFSEPSQTYLVIDKNRPTPVEVREVFVT